MVLCSDECVQKNNDNMATIAVITVKLAVQRFSRESEAFGSSF